MSVKRAGAICGNPLNGLCVRECIEVNKVFDGCMSRMDDVEFTVMLPDTGAPFPYRFISARSTGDTVITNLIILPSDNGRSKVSFDATVPMSIAFLDASNAEHVVIGAVGLSREVILHLPSESLTPFNIGASTNIIAISGNFVSPTQLHIVCCVAQVSKVFVKVELLVPSYGYCEYPRCDEPNGNGESDCEGMPLFPPLI